MRLFLFFVLIQLVGFGDFLGTIRQVTRLKLAITLFEYAWFSDETLSLLKLSSMRLERYFRDPDDAGDTGPLSCLSGQIPLPHAI